MRNEVTEPASSLDSARLSFLLSRAKQCVKDAAHLHAELAGYLPAAPGGGSGGGDVGGAAFEEALRRSTWSVRSLQDACAALTSLQMPRETDGSQDRWVSNTLATRRTVAHIVHSHPFAPTFLDAHPDFSWDVAVSALVQQVQCIEFS